MTNKEQKGILDFELDIPPIEVSIEIPSIEIPRLELDIDLEAAAKRFRGGLSK